MKYSWCTAVKPYSTVPVPVPHDNIPHPRLRTLCDEETDSDLYVVKKPLTLPANKMRQNCCQRLCDISHHLSTLRKCAAGKGNSLKCPCPYLDTGAFTGQQPQSIQPVRSLVQSNIQQGSGSSSALTSSPHPPSIKLDDVCKSTTSTPPPSPPPYLGLACSIPDYKFQQITVNLGHLRFHPWTFSLTSKLGQPLTLFVQRLVHWAHTQPGVDSPLPKLITRGW